MKCHLMEVSIRADWIQKLLLFIVRGSVTTTLLRSNAPQSNQVIQMCTLRFVCFGNLSSFPRVRLPFLHIIKACITIFPLLVNLYNRLFSWKTWYIIQISQSFCKWALFLFFSLSQFLENKIRVERLQQTGQMLLLPFAPSHRNVHCIKWFISTILDGYKGEFFCDFGNQPFSDP